MKTTSLIFWTLSSVFPCVVHRISTILQMLTEWGDRYGSLVIFVIDLSHVIRGVIFLLTAVKNMKASVERLAHEAWRFCRAEYWAASARANGRRGREKHFSLLPSQSPRSFTTPDPLHDVYLMLKRHLFKSFLSSG